MSWTSPHHRGRTSQHTGHKESHQLPESKTTAHARLRFDINILKRQSCSDSVRETSALWSEADWFKIGVFVFIAYTKLFISFWALLRVRREKNVKGFPIWAALFRFLSVGYLMLACESGCGMETAWATVKWEERWGVGNQRRVLFC